MQEEAKNLSYNIERLRCTRSYCEVKGDSYTVIAKMKLFHCYVPGDYVQLSVG